MLYFLPWLFSSLLPVQLYTGLVSVRRKKELCLPRVFSITLPDLSGMAKGML